MFVVTEMQTVVLPLHKAHRIRLARAFARVPRLDLTIDCVLEGQMGKAYADAEKGPSVFAVQAGPFIYFAGDPRSPGARRMMEELLPSAFLMPSMPGFLELASESFGPKLEPVPRFRYSAEGVSTARLDQLEAASRYPAEVVRMDLPFLTRAWGRSDVIELSDFDSPEDFLERGIGFHLSRGEKFIGAAYSSLVSSKGIEVSVFVRQDYRRQGIASEVTCRLLQWCLEQNVEPHWDAANPESCRLAEKLGYSPAGEYMAHFLIP